MMLLPDRPEAEVIFGGYGDTPARVKQVVADLGHVIDEIGILHDDLTRAAKARHPRDAKTAYQAAAVLRLGLDELASTMSRYFEPLGTAVSSDAPGSADSGTGPQP